jgi:phospholipid/cholesterol/gamma-HCH transport system substrate-binding protein
MIVVLAILLFGGVYVFLANYRIGSYKITAEYTDAQGLSKGSSVTMAGVTIGSVDLIELDEHQRAIVTLKIDPKFKIPTGSVFVLHVGLLVGEKQIDIVPNRKSSIFLQPGMKVQGQVPTSLEDLIPQGEKLLASLTEASENLNDMLSDKELKGRMDRTFANFEDASAKLNQTMTMLQETTSGQQGNVKKIVENLAAASDDVRTTTHQISTFVKEGKMQSNLTDIMAATTRTLETLDRTTASLEQLITDPQFQSDIKGSVAGARKTVEATNEAVARLNRILGSGRGKPGKHLKTRETGIQGLYNPADDRLRIDAKTSLDFGNEKFLDLGIYDVGVNNKLIVQPGFALSSKADARYGVYASRLGIGIDYDFSKRAFGKMDLYDSVSPRLDILSGYRVGEGMDVLLGVDKVFKDNQLTLGVRFTR